MNALPATRSYRTPPSPNHGLKQPTTTLTMCNSKNCNSCRVEKLTRELEGNKAFLVHMEQGQAGSSLSLVDSDFNKAVLSKMNPEEILAFIREIHDPQVKAELTKEVSAFMSDPEKSNMSIGDFNTILTALGEDVLIAAVNKNSSNAKTIGELNPETIKKDCEDISRRTILSGRDHLNDFLRPVPTATLSNELQNYVASLEGPIAAQRTAGTTVEGIGRIRQTLVAARVNQIKETTPKKCCTIM